MDTPSGDVLLSAAKISFVFNTRISYLLPVSLKEEE